jgi:hypothetical protein
MTDDLADRAGTDQQYFHEKPYFPEIHGQMSERSVEAGWRGRLVLLSNLLIIGNQFGGRKEALRCQ